MRSPSLCLCLCLCSCCPTGQGMSGACGSQGGLADNMEQLECKGGINMSLPFGCIPRFFRAILALLSLCASVLPLSPKFQAGSPSFRGLAGGGHWARPFVSCLALGGREQGIAAGGRRRFGGAAVGGRRRAVAGEGITGQYRETRRALRQ